MKIRGINVDKSKLMSKQELLGHLEEGGSTNRALANVREQYLTDFGNELIWTYPISDGLHTGAIIVTVQEGFLSIPYEIITQEDYEVFELDKARIHDEESLEYFISDYQSFSDDLIGALKDMQRILGGEDLTPEAEAFYMRKEFVKKCGELLRIAKPSLISCEIKMGSEIHETESFKPYERYVPENEYVVVTCENKVRYVLPIEGNSLAAIADEIFSRMVSK